MTRLLAIDPGSSATAFVVLDTLTELPIHYGKWPNEVLLSALRWNAPDDYIQAADDVVVEWMAPRGMPTSAQEMETLFWIGRFVEAIEYRTGKRVNRLTRLKVKLAICGTMKAKDTNIRQALIDRYGGSGGKAAAVGLKASPGPLYGVAADVWAALALALAWLEQPKA